MKLTKALLMSAEKIKKASNLKKTIHYATNGSGDTIQELNIR
jgi:hypothetical protein